jgi:hypothetical protein
MEQKEKIKWLPLQFWSDLVLLNRYIYLVSIGHPVDENEYGDWDQ